MHNSGAQGGQDTVELHLTYSALTYLVTFYDANATFGGPIKSDRLWFFTATRASRNKNTVVGLYFNKTIGTPFYTPDLDRPAYRTEWLKSIGNRLTWQASDKNKVSVFGDLQAAYNRGRGEFRSPEAYMNMYNFWPQGLVQATWSSPRTNRLLLEAGVSLTLTTIPYPSPGSGDFASKRRRFVHRPGARHTRLVRAGRR